MKSLKSDAPDTYMLIHFTPYVHTDHCPSCGCDPRVLYANGLVSDWDENLRLERPTQFCHECAMMRAVFDARRLNIHWEQKTL